MANEKLTPLVKESVITRKRWCRIHRKISSICNIQFLSLFLSLPSSFTVLSFPLFLSVYLRATELKFIKSTIHVLRAVTPFSLLFIPPFTVIGLYLLSPVSFNFIRIPRIGFASRPRSRRRGIRDLSTFSSGLRYFQLYRARSPDSSIF